MNEVSVLVGGKAGDGINSAGAMVAQLLNHLGYRIYLYFDYPSLIRGGHNFAIVRGRETAPGTCGMKVDFVLALDQETVERHKDAWKTDTAVIFNKDLVKSTGQGIPVKEILAAEHAPDIMGNSAVIGGFAKAAGIPWKTVEAVFSSHIPKGTDQNLRVAQRAYDMLETVHPLSPCDNPPVPLLTGNEAIGLGMVNGGLEAYISYPMTPSSSLLHFLAEEQENLGITVVHPENEIAVILMALGFASAGKRAAVGTSGGGFCLMTEGLSLAGMAELTDCNPHVPEDRPVNRSPDLYRPVRSPVRAACRAGRISPASSLHRELRKKPCTGRRLPCILHGNSRSPPSSFPTRPCPKVPTVPIFPVFPKSRMQNPALVGQDRSLSSLC